VGGFAECQPEALGKASLPLPSATSQTLGKASLPLPSVTYRHSAKRPPLPSVVRVTLGKESGLCRVAPLGVRQSDRNRHLAPSDNFSLPSGLRALGKAFAECPTKDTRQRGICRHRLCRVIFAEGYTRQRLCRVYMGICRVSQALGKEPESGSDI